MDISDDPASVVSGIWDANCLILKFSSSGELSYNCLCYQIGKDLIAHVELVNIHEVAKISIASTINSYFPYIWVVPFSSLNQPCTWWQ